MRLLIINPNTTPAMTRKVGIAARALLPEAEIIEATGRFGAAYIASRASFAIAGHATLDCYAEHGAGCDAVLLACFGDPGLDALREVAPVPVIGLVEAAAAEAGAAGRRFAIVTGGERWGPMLTDAMRLRGLAAQLTGIHTVAPSGGDIARDPAGAMAVLRDACRHAITDEGAEAVILGGAGLIGLAAALQPDFSQPILCSVAAGLRATQAALRADPVLPASFHPAPVETVNLSGALEALIAGQPFSASR